MSLTIAALVLASALLHPFWNMLLKQDSDPRLGFVFLTATMSLCGLLHALATGADLLAPKAILPFMAMSLFGQVLYGTCLTATLQRGDLSVYYPIIRASPVFIVAVGFLLLGRTYEIVMLSGIAMAVLGGFILLYRRGSRMLKDPATLGLAVLAMSGSGIYSIADEQTMQVVAPSVHLFWIEAVLVPFYFAIYLHGRQRNSQSHGLLGPRLTLRRALRLAVPGILAYTSYAMVLHAYALGGEVAAVTSVRQASIPISVLLGGYFLNEGSVLRRLIASAVLAFGIVIVVVTA